MAASLAPPPSHSPPSLASTTHPSSKPQSSSKSNPTSLLIQQILDPAAPPPNYDFAFADFLKREYRFGIPPNRPLCKAFQEGHCPLGNACPDKHQSTRIRDVCKHWLKGLCKRGDMCEFLHEYNIRRMPECTHYARHLSCPNGDDCLYQHIDPISKLPPCPHYERGFCPLGPRCGKSHFRKTLCRFYLAGFCPYGRQCKNGAHPRWAEEKDLPRMVSRTEVLRVQAAERERREAMGEMGREEEGGDRGGFGGREWERDGREGRDAGRGGRERREGGRGRGRGRWGGRKRY